MDPTRSAHAKLLAGDFLSLAASPSAPPSFSRRGRPSPARRPPASSSPTIAAKAAPFSPRTTDPAASPASSGLTTASSSIPRLPMFTPARCASGSSLGFEGELRDSAEFCR
ncbi:hypothetical protein KSP40_PGU019208 [Platanthera guangdongensis]|uniref:Uncharacterized protein n=1 Tax=Platanthera guangdongensis TaxID=2320717 RepID=A0ABR2MW02_9ASPA